MTTAPPELIRARALFIRYLDVHPGQRVGNDLDPDEVGITKSQRHTDM